MAKNKLAGITLEIGGDTTKLSDALKEPNKEAGQLQQKLKAVNDALKLDPTNTDLLAQKQRILSSLVENTESKLTLLKKAQEEFIASGKDVDSAEYVELQKQIFATENKLKSLNSQQSKVSANLQSFGIKAEEFGKKSVDAGKKASILSAGIIGIGVASQKAFSEVDEGLDNVAKGTGATGEALNGLQKSFTNVFTTMPVEVDEASSAVADLNTRLGFTGKQLEKASKDFLKFAEVNNTDVSTAIALVTRAMGDANIKSSEYSKLLDQLTAASQASGISIDKLTEMITKYGAPMRALGYDTAESIAIFASWEKAGVNTEIAFSGMKKAISNYTKEGKDAKVEFEKLVKGIQNGSISSQKALEILGSKAGPDLVDAIQQGRFSFEDMLSIVEKSSGQMASTYEATLDPIDKAKIAINNLKIAGTELSNSIQTTLTPVFEKLTEIITKFTQWFTSLDEKTKTFIVIVAMIVAALGPILIFIGKIAMGMNSLIALGIKIVPVLKTIGSILSSGLGLLKTISSFISSGVITVITKLQGVAVTAFGMLKTVALGAFNAILAHPIIAGIAAIIAIIVALYMKCEWFRDGVNAILKAIFEFVKNAFNSIKDFLFKTVPETITGVINWYIKLRQKIIDILVDIVNKIFDFGKDMFKAGTEAASNLYNSIWNGIKSLPSKMFNWGQEMIEHLGDGIASMIGWIGDKAKSIADTIASWLHFTLPDKGPLRKVPTWMPDMMKEMGKSIDKNLWMMEKPMSNLAKSMSLDFGGNVKKVLDYNKQTTINNPIQIDLDGKPIYQNVVTRITRTQGIRTQFKGAY